MADSDQEVFVHQSAIQMDGFRSLAENEKVSFDIEQTPRGTQRRWARVFC